MRNMRMRFPGGHKKAFTGSYDAGVEQDIRLIEIMRKNGIKGTFNLNSGCFAEEGHVYPAGQVHRRMSLETCKKVYTGSDIEVAVHGETHPFLESLPSPVAVSDIINDRLNLEKHFGCLVRGCAYPYGTYSDTVVDALRLSGIVYARTVETRLNFDIPKDWLRMGATCHHNNAALNDLTEQFTKSSPARVPWLFYLWGHSYEFEGDNNWHVIEKCLSNIGGKDDIWYATNIQIYDYIKAYEALISSADGRILYNPTCTDVWAEIDGTTERIPAGSALALA